METSRKRPGRRPGEYKEYPYQQLTRMKQEDRERLARLAQVWKCTRAEAMRRALHEAARLEGVE